MLEVKEHKRWLKNIIFYIFVASTTIIVLSIITANFKAYLDEGDKCGYNACILAVNNADASKAQLLSCRCQCESTQVLTDECRQIYTCDKNDCWRLNEK